MKALDGGWFAVYVYREIGNRHHLPHCHVRWSGRESVVTMPALNRIAGAELPRVLRRALIVKIDIICAAWNEVNPEHPIL
jgi:hypothetical protein